jgi:hypothetical protein
MLKSSLCIHENPMKKHQQLIPMSRVTTNIEWGGVSAKVKQHHNPPALPKNQSIIFYSAASYAKYDDILIFSLSLSRARIE